MDKIEKAALKFFESFYHFYRYYAWDFISQDEFVDNWHIRYLCQELHQYRDAVVKRRPIEDLIINIPPGSSKSSIISQAFPVWLWLHDPSVTVIVSSYAAALSTDHSIKAKRIIQNPQFVIFFDAIFQHLHGKSLQIEKDNEGYWSNNYGGQYITTSTGGSVTGRHAHLIIRDDPMNPEQAESTVYRVKAHRFNDATLSTRKKNKDATPTITVMQRLHEDDTTAHELGKDKECRHICLPAELSSKVRPEYLQLEYIDGLLDPVRMSRETLERQRNDVGTYAYSGQFGQEPYPEEGGKVKKEWFCYLDEKDLLPGLVWDVWVDGAYTDKTANDPSGIMICAFDILNNRLIVRNFESRWMVLPDLLKHIKAMEFGVDGASMVYVEPKASGLSLIQELQQNSLMNVSRITGKLVQAGKEARLNTASPKIESSRVWLVRGNWNDEFVKQLTGFPNVSHDEAVDLLGYACKKYLF